METGRIAMLVVTKIQEIVFAVQREVGSLESLGAGASVVTSDGRLATIAVSRRRAVGRAGPVGSGLPHRVAENRHLARFFR
jgi:hypothetical protein